MKILIAPDSFKGSLASGEAARMIEDAARRVLGCETLRIPMADGGEGTLEAIVDSSGGTYVDVPATGPLGETVKARYGLIDGGKTAVIEMARASGITLVKKLDPISASSHGTGELIKNAVSRGVETILIAIGGSATNDGGMGMLTALGARFYDDAGNQLYGNGGDLEKVAAVDLSCLPKLDITVICDVTNPLLGDTGATYIYGPQKGADKDTLIRLERGMANYAAVLEGAGCTACDFPGSGAAGGMGYALTGVLGARMRSGIDAVLDAVRFDDLLCGVDLVVTGEGRLDGQSVMYGKVPAGIAKRCRDRGIPVVALVGGLGEGAEMFLELGDTTMEPITDGPRSLESAMQNAGELLYRASVRLFSSIRIGKDIQSRSAQ